MAGIVDYQLPAFEEEHRVWVGDCLLLGMMHKDIARIMRYCYPELGKNTPEDLFVSTVIKRIKKNSAELRSLAMQSRVYAITEDMKDDILVDARRLWSDLELAKSKMNPANTSTAWTQMVKAQITILNIRLRNRDGVPVDPPSEGVPSGDGSTLDDGDEDNGVPIVAMKDRSNLFASLKDKKGVNEV